ncbi:MAG: nucleoside recognition domain-containing protein, partial [Bacteroidota bacterium]
MTLTRIWAAFVLIAFIVGGSRLLNGDDKIFVRMITGKSSDRYDSTFYLSVGNPTHLGLAANYSTFLAEYGYFSTAEPAKASFLLHDFRQQDSIAYFTKMYPSLTVSSYIDIQSKLVRKVDGVIETAKNAFLDIILPLVGILALFMGFLSIAEKAGGVRLLSRLIWPFFSRIFPEVPKGHPATGHMMMNFSANLLNLDNAATPFGLKAMESLQELNPNKNEASNAQLMFLA